MTEVFVPIEESRIVSATLRNLRTRYGNITVNNGRYLFHDTTHPPDTVVRAAREVAIQDINASIIKDECTTRIMQVLKDYTTQLNITGYVLDIVSRIQNPVTGEEVTDEERTDIETARAIKQWIGAMQAASRELIDAMDPTYADNNHWPVPPAGVGEFVDRF